ELFDDGRYIARLLKIEIEPSPNDKKRTVANYFWKFIEGDYAGKSHRSFQGWENEEQFVYFLRDLDRLGYDVSEIEDYAEDIPGILKSIAKDKPICLVRLRT